VTRVSLNAACDGEANKMTIMNEKGSEKSIVEKDTRATNHDPLATSCIVQPTMQCERKEGVFGRWDLNPDQPYYSPLASQMAPPQTGCDRTMTHLVLVHRHPNMLASAWRRSLATSACLRTTMEDASCRANANAVSSAYPAEVETVTISGRR